MKESPREYLDKHLEPSKEQTDIPLGLTERLLPSREYNEWGGNMEAEKGPIKVSFDYGPPASHAVINALLDIKTANADDIKNWRQMFSYNLTDNQGNKLELDSFISETDAGNLYGPGQEPTSEKKSDTFFTTQPKTKGMTSKAETSLQGRIILEHDIMTPAGGIALLHEIGHHVDFSERDPDSFKETLRRRAFFLTLNRNLLKAGEKENEIIEQAAMELLEMERNASAFALNKLRPFIRAGTLKKEDVLGFIHDYGLAPYTAGLSKRLNPTKWEQIKTKFASYINTFFDVR